MAEVSYFWDGATGDGTNYDDSILMDTLFRAIFAGTGNEGVLKGWLNELEPTDAGGLNVDVDTGGAIVYGLFYESDAVETIAMPNNATNWIVVRRSWAAQTARLTVVAALIQTPDVTYDIPIAQVTTVAGAITLLTDSRDFCEFSTTLDLGAVTSTEIDTDAATTAKLINQTRRFSRAAGCLEPDGTNPAAWVINVTNSPWGDHWSFVDGVVNSVWCAFRVPADITGNLTVKLWDTTPTGSTGDVLWGYDAYIAAPGAVLASTAGTTLQTFGATSRFDYAEKFDLASLAVSAGDLVHMELYRDGGHGIDSLANFVALIGIEFTYTADS